MKIATEKAQELGRPFSAFQAIFKRDEIFLQNFRENAAFWRFLLFSGRDLSTDDSLETCLYRSTSSISKAQTAQHHEN